MPGQQVNKSTSQEPIERSLPSLRIVWAAIRSLSDAGGATRLARVSFTLAIDVLDDQHAMIEAWTENPDHRGTVFHRQPVRCEITHDGRHFHLDATGDDGDRWLRLTMSVDEASEATRPTFAQTSLIAQAGFAAGSFDPPMLHQQPVIKVAATA